MLIDLRALGRQLSARRVRRQARLVGAARLRGAGAVHRALRGAMDRVRARRQKRDADRLLVVLDRRRRAAAWSMRFIAATRCSSPARPSACSSICAISISCCASGGAAVSRLIALKTPAPPRSAAKPRSRSAIRSLDVLEPDMEAHRRAARRPVRRGAILRCSRTGWRGSRSRPTKRPCRTASARRGRRAPPSRGTGLSTMLNRPQAPVKSRFQIAWPGSLVERRMQHAQHLRPLLRASARPSRPDCMVAREPHRQRAQAAQPEIHVVGADAQAHACRRCPCSRGQRRLVGRDGAEHHVGMAADIFGAGLDRRDRRLCRARVK